MDEGGEGGDNLIGGEENEVKNNNEGGKDIKWGGK